MNLHLDDQQRLLRESMAKLMATESTPARVRAAEATGFDPALWQTLVDAGVPALRVAVADGGLGGSLLEAQLVAEEAGRRLASVPLAEALVATRLLSQLATGGAAQAWRERALAGALVTLALQPCQRGVAQVVPAGAAAEAVLACEGEQVWLVPLTPGAAVERNLGGAALARLDLADPGLPRFLVAQGAAARRAFEAGVEEWKLLTAALLGGLAHEGLRLAAAYSVERHAFGRPIGGFQGIAHALADAVTEVEGAQLMAWHAASEVAHRRPGAAAVVSMAYWWAAQSAARAMTRALHTFGGYGLSLEYDIQLYYRRAKAWALLAGDPQEELLRVAERLWGGADVALPEGGEVGIDFALGATAEAFGAEVDAYFKRHLTPELRAHAHHSVAGYHPAFHRQLAREGYLFPHWPAQWGGRGRGAYDMAALAAAFEANGWEHVTASVTNQVAQVVMQFATPEVQAEALPRFAAGEALACLGFTEPSCGCDVFAARTKAELQPDGRWRIDGQKIFTTAANVAQYCFLLARTNPDKPKHAGLSMFLVPMDSPGIEIHPVHTLQDERTNIVYFSEVMLEAKYLIGPVDGGLQVMASTLELEHGGADHYRHGHVTMVHAAEQWARQATRHGRPLLQDRDAAGRLARARVHLEVSTVLCRRGIWAMAEHVPSRYFGPMAKVFATEYYQRDAMDLMDLAAPDSLFAGRAGLGHLELGYRQSIGTTIYGGTSEVQRSLVAEQALGCPKSRS